MSTSLNFFRRLTRVKTLHNDNLLHTEWTRRLGAAQLMGIAGVISLPLGVFVFIPYCIKFVAGPSCILSLIISFVLLILGGMHLIELCCALPKSALIYNFAYASAGEIWAFLLGWLSILDYTIVISIAAHAWSSHTNLLFNSNIHKTLMIKFSAENNPILSENFDCLALIGVSIASLLLLMSLRVASTISIILLIVAALIVSSSVLVGFFYANPMNWLTPGFFPNGYVGILQGTSCLLYAYVGLETLTFVIDETCQPRKKLPAVFPLCNGLLSVYFFLVALVVTLATDYRKLTFETLVPNVFDHVRVPAAKYILTVGSVCGLSGSLLAVFLPVTRQLACMGQDGLLPSKLKNMGRKSGSPYWAILLAFVLSSALLCLSVNTLMEVLTISIPLRLLVAVLLTIPQHYTANPIGLAGETADYRHLRRKHSMTSYLTANGSVSTLARSETFPEDQYSITSSQLCRSIAIHQANMIPDESTNERSSLLIEDSIMTKSVSKYNTILNEDKDKDELSLKTISLNAIPFSNVSHNCLKSPCSPLDTSIDDPRNFHLYDREIPELPYFADSNTKQRVSTPVDQRIEWLKAKRCLISFLTLSILSSLVIDKLDWAVSDGKWWAMGALCILLTVLVVNGTVMCYIETNKKLSRRKNSVSGFPVLSLLTIFFLCLVLCSCSFVNYLKMVAWALIGVPIYMIYGYKHSRENRENNADLILENAQATNKEKEAIIPQTDTATNSVS